MAFDAAYRIARDLEAIAGGSSGALPTGQAAAPSGPASQSDASPYGGGWMLTDGKALKLGTLLQPHVIPLPAGTKCFISGKAATCWVLWGRSY